MNRRSSACVLCVLTVCFAWQAMAASGPVERYGVVDTIAGADGDWDYVFADPSTHRLYLAREDGVDALDLTTRRWQRKLVSGAAVRGVTATASQGEYANSNSKTDTVTVFNGATGAIRGSVHVGPGPDALAFDARSGLLAAIGADSGDVTLVDPEKLAVVGTVHIGGKLEFAVASGAGYVYVNEASASAIAVLNVAARRVEGHFRLRHCSDPSGLGYLPAAHPLLVSACGNGVAKVISASDGAELASVPIGRGPDAVVIDSQRNLAFIPCGDDGTLSVIELLDGQPAKSLGSVKTQVGARTGALDAGTGRIYLPAATLVPPAAPGSWPSIQPGTFRIVVLAPRALPSGSQ